MQANYLLLVLRIVELSLYPGAYVGGALYPQPANQRHRGDELCEQIKTCCIAADKSERRCLPRWFYSYFKAHNLPLALAMLILWPARTRPLGMYKPTASGSKNATAIRIRNPPPGVLAHRSTIWPGGCVYNSWTSFAERRTRS